MDHIHNLEVIGQTISDFGVVDLAADYPEISCYQIADINNISAKKY